LPRCCQRCKAAKADIVISDIYATKERAKAADFITYSKVFGGVMVAKGNPKKITGINMSMCGDAAAENTGFVEVPLVQNLAPAWKKAGRAMELLTRVSLAQRADALPRHLSGGQQQRVAIARALAPRPSVLLLDEPTSALDPELVSEVLDVIRRLAVEEGLTMLISTHQLSFAREVADRVVFLSGGQVAEDGPADEVFARPRHPLTARYLKVMGAELATAPAA